MDRVFVCVCVCIGCPFFLLLARFCNRLVLCFNRQLRRIKYNFPLLLLLLFIQQAGRS